MYHLSTRVKVIQFWLGGFSGRNVRDDVAETQMTKRALVRQNSFRGNTKTKDIIKLEKQ